MNKIDIEYIDMITENSLTCFWSLECTALRIVKFLGFKGSLEMILCVIKYVVKLLNLIGKK